ncbi:unnamed protein product [Caenorhabditis bovis]|uniref:PDZ domain-containing protein n=1 Tax=Caenorhabditis bovis TaxID=2654633 RepID=A0A8S1FAY1_9PELO|nr:unnamed protein product [Caenorhabditis bovis]
MSGVTEHVNRLASAFNRAMADIVSSELNADIIEHLKVMSTIFTEACSLAESCAAETETMRKENAALGEQCLKLKTKSSAVDDVIQQIHLLLTTKAARNADRNAIMIMEKLKEDVELNMRKIEKYHKYKEMYEMEKCRANRMLNHVNEMSKLVVMQRIGSRFFAREVAALRQMMDLVRNARSIDAAAKAHVWDEIEAENMVLRVNTLWLINRINGSDRKDAAYENDEDVHSPPRVVILLRSHPHQGLGLEITGGSEQFRPIIVTGKLKGSMADDDELHLGDRLISVDGTFITNTTTHSEAMKLLEEESTKDYLALVVSAFNPWLSQQSHHVIDEQESTQGAHE